MVDLLSEKKQSRGFGELHKAMQIIADEGRGIIVLLRENADTSLSNILVNRQSQSRESAKEGSQDLRDYGVGAQILSDLNVQDMVLLSNSQPNIVGLDGYGLSIAGWRSISS